MIKRAAGCGSFFILFTSFITIMVSGCVVPKEPHWGTLVHFVLYSTFYFADLRKQNRKLRKQRTAKLVMICNHDF